MDQKHKAGRTDSLVQLTEAELLDIVETTQAVHAAPEGKHFKLLHGNHSDVYFDLDRISATPKQLGRLTGEFIAWLKSEFGGGTNAKNIDVVLSQITRPRLLAYDIVRAFNGSMRSRGAYAEVDPLTGHVLPKLTFASSIAAGENVVIVTDILTFGASLETLTQIVETRKANLLAVLAVAARNKRALSVLQSLEVDKGVKSHVLRDYSDEWEDWTPEDCPRCKAGSKLIELRGGYTSSTGISVLQFNGSKEEKAA